MLLNIVLTSSGVIGGPSEASAPCEDEDADDVSPDAVERVRAEEEEDDTGGMGRGTGWPVMNGVRLDWENERDWITHPRQEGCALRV